MRVVVFLQVKPAHPESALWSEQKFGFIAHAWALANNIRQEDTLVTVNLSQTYKGALPQVVVKTSATIIPKVIVCQDSKVDFILKSTFSF